MAQRFSQDAARLAPRLRTSDSVLVLRPALAAAAARDALKAFPGVVAYAVKTQNHPVVLRAIADAGMRDWDVASLGEVRQLHELFPCGHRLLFMNPVRPAGHTAAAHALGVREFAYDCADGLAATLRETAGDPGVVPVLRIAVPGGGALLALEGKFGCAPEAAPGLLRAAAAAGLRPGVTFHVGSQCVDPRSFARAVSVACGAAREAGIDPGVVDIGGGFPARYVGGEPGFGDCVAEAVGALREGLPGWRGELRCEPGRLLSAPSASVLVRVELRRGATLFLSDGIYGLLSELKHLPGQHPVRLVRPDARGPVVPFALMGPTCDSMDSLPGPWLLPDDVRGGDLLEVGLCGAYSNVLATRFNGLGGWAEEVEGEPRAMAA